MREGDWGSFKGAMQVRLMLLACWACFYSGCGGRGERHFEELLRGVGMLWSVMSYQSWLCARQLKVIQQECNA